MLAPLIMTAMQVIDEPGTTLKRCSWQVLLLLLLLLLPLCDEDTQEVDAEKWRGAPPKVEIE